VSSAHEVAVTSARRVERSVLVIRWVMVAFVAVMTWLFDPISVPLTVAVALGLLAVNVRAHLTLPGLGDLAAARRAAWWSVGIDSTAAVVTYLAFLADPSAMPVALLVLLLFELSLRFGGWGTGVGAVAFLVGIGVRVHVQRSVLDGGEVRAELLVLWAAFAVLAVAFAREFWSQERRRTAALAERQRLAEDLRSTVVGTLERSGVPAGAATHDEVLAAVEAILGGASEEREALVERLAMLLAAPHQGLTPRELEILLLLGQGHSDARIATTLFISPSTVRNHVRNVRTKLGLASRDELRAYAARYTAPPS
jgi:DNA-binding CsgD family transcriptional regulator